uniref:S-acyltransferase n=1 Tax=Aegilops tauschii subsp. strangulata TaxID=200361 RepID=A0A453GDT5_AEGTS
MIVQRNYRFFYMFVFSTTLLCLYVFGFSWVYIIKIRDAEQITIWKAMAKTPASIALVVYTFIAVWFVGGLSVFHLYLMSTNQVNDVPWNGIFPVSHRDSVLSVANHCCLLLL